MYYLTLFVSYCLFCLRGTGGSTVDVEVYIVAS